MTRVLAGGSGIAYDVRKAFPYSGYEKYDFEVPTRDEGDAYARFLVRLDEMDQRIDRMKKDFDYKLCQLSAQQLGAAATPGAPNALPCNGAASGATYAPPAPSDTPPPPSGVTRLN